MNKYWYWKGHKENIYYIKKDCLWSYKLQDSVHNGGFKRGRNVNCTIIGGFDIPGRGNLAIDKSGIPFTLELIFIIDEKYDIPPVLLKDMLKELVNGS